MTPSLPFNRARCGMPGNGNVDATNTVDFVRTDYNTALVIAACLSAVAAILQVGIIVGGTTWCRFFGAGGARKRASIFSATSSTKVMIQ